jgi:phosphocarrier protein HPr
MHAMDVTVVNQLGMHARAAARFVQLASSFQARITVERRGRTVDGKSILGLLLLAAGRGTTITISAHGPDETDAVRALAALIDARFGEES